MILTVVGTFSRMQSRICLELHNKVTNSFLKRCNWNCKWKLTWNALENALWKMDLRVQMDAISGQLKIKSMSESVNRKTINVFQEPLTIQFKVHLIIQLELHLKVNFNIYIYRDAEESARDIALKCPLLVALELHLFMQLPMNKSVQNGSTV